MFHNPATMKKQYSEGVVIDNAKNYSGMKYRPDLS